MSNNSKLEGSLGDRRRDAENTLHQTLHADLTTKSALPLVNKESKK